MALALVVALPSCKEAEASANEKAVIVAMDQNCIGIASDAILTEGVKAAIKDYPGVNAAIENGVITLTGSIPREHAGELMTAIQSMRASRIIDRLEVK